MGAASVDGPNGELIQSTGAMFGRFSAELLPQLGEWERQLLEDPGQLEIVERDVQQAFQRGGGPDDRRTGIRHDAVAETARCRRADAAGLQSTAGERSGASHQRERPWWRGDVGHVAVLSGPPIAIGKDRPGRFRRL